MNFKFLNWGSRRKKPAIQIIEKKGDIVLTYNTGTASSSDGWVIIPADPQFFPTEEKMWDCMIALVATFPDSEIQSRAGVIQFATSGQGFESILCNLCGSEFNIDTWSEMMDKAYESQFENLDVTMPCCGGVSSLNNLDYNTPQGLAKYDILVMQNYVDGDDDKIKNLLEGILDTGLRVFWLHI